MSELLNHQTYFTYRWKEILDVEIHYRRLYQPCLRPKFPD
jgi:hypothetical protein